jgi:hypothetical protein
MAAKKRTIKYDPDETSWLVSKAKGFPIEGYPTNYAWIDKLTQLEARDELLERFKRVVATLVDVCLTGKPNLFSWPQRSFLKMFGTKTTPVQNIASMLKRELSIFDKEELFNTGQLAILLAIEKTNSNLVSTIVIQFKELIYKMIKDGRTEHVEYDNIQAEAEDFEGGVAFTLFLESLNEEEWMAAQILIEGGKVKNIPPTLVIKLRNYCGLDNISI